MNKSILNHSDCLNFIPVDVAKGICNFHSKEILVEGNICEDFKILAECKNCSCFTEPDSKGTGKCTGFPDNYWTFASLKAVNCEKYKEAIDCYNHALQIEPGNNQVRTMKNETEKYIDGK